jgi:serine/threonine protein kinase
MSETILVTRDISCVQNVPFYCFRFYLVFEKVNGGPLLTRIQEHIHFTEREASQIIGDLASALQFLHVKGEFLSF